VALWCGAARAAHRPRPGLNHHDGRFHIFGFSHFQKTRFVKSENEFVLSCSRRPRLGRLIRLDPTEPPTQHAGHLAKAWHRRVACLGQMLAACLVLHAVGRHAFTSQAARAAARRPCRTAGPGSQRHRLAPRGPWPRPPRGQGQRYHVLSLPQRRCLSPTWEERWQACVVRPGPADRPPSTTWRDYPPSFHIYHFGISRKHCEK